MDQLEPTTLAEDERERATQTLFRDIDRSGALPEHVTALEAADVVLCALEMRLPRSEAEAVERDLPPMLGMLISRCVVTGPRNRRSSSISPVFCGWLRAHLASPPWSLRSD